MPGALGAVQSLWRFPVKSMLGERLDSAELTAVGMVGDRAYGVVEAGTGKVLSGKTRSLGRLLLACRAEFVEPPQAGAAAPPVRISMPDGTATGSDARNCDAVLSTYLGRPVRLTRTAPDDFTIDQYHPDVEDLDPHGHRDAVTEQKLGSALFGELGLPSAVPAGAFYDVFPVSVLTTSTLARLSALRPQSRFDERRFRMNIVVDSPAEGFVENAWPGRHVQIGEEVRLAVAMPDPRCVMTTLAQQDLPQDDDILRTLVRQNRLEVAGGLYPCAGVYAVVDATGTVSAGDDVVLA